MHPLIVPVKEVFEAKNYAYTVCLKGENRNLEEVLKDGEEPMKEDLVLKIFT